MGFGMWIAGFILLANPVVNVVDILPDAIGFFLLTAGMTKMSFFIGKLAQARSLCLKLAFLEIAKFFSIALLPYTSGSAKILLSFVFGLAELLLFLPAMNALFDGLSFAALWYHGTAVYEKKTVKRFGKEKTVELLSHTRLTVISFYVFRVVATLIPELTELQMYDYIGDVTAFSRALTYYKPFLYIVFGLATLIFGIRYCIAVTKYFRAVGRDEEFIRNLNRKYDEDIRPKTTFFLSRAMKNALFLFAGSAVTSIMLTADGVNLMVGAVSAALLIAASCIVGKYVKAAYAIIPLAVFRAALSVVNLILQIRYFSEYSVEAVEWITKAHDSYYTMAMLICTENIVALAAFLFFTAVLMKAVKQHLEVCGIQTDNAMYSKRNRDLETYNTVGGKLLLCSVLAIIHYVLACAYPYLCVHSEMIIVVTTAVTILFFSYVIYTVNVIGSLLYDKEIETVL